MSNQVVLMTALLNAGAFQLEDKEYVRTMLRHNAELLAPQAMKLMQLQEPAA